MVAERRLHIGDGLDLPLEAVTEAFALLGRRGSGKTSTAVVMAEEMLDARQPVVVLDPLGVWWGLRANADGSPNDLPVVIVGGEHADLPLDEHTGRALARLLVSTRQSAVVDFSALSRAGMRRVAADFLEELYHRNRDPLHLIVDEADLLAPQRLPQDMTRLLGTMEDVVRRGRARGLGVTLITQRPAVISKDVLSQAETLVALRLTSPRDIGAIDEWVRGHGDDEQAREVKKSLPSLPVGTAWVWSPGWLDLLAQVRVRPRRTFDSSATPKPGAARRSARLGENLDVATLRVKLAEFVDAGKPGGKAKASRPSQPSAGMVVAPPFRPTDASIREAELAGLREQVRTLTAQLEAARNTAAPEPVRVEVPVLTGDDRTMLSGLARALHATGDMLAGMLSRLDDVPPTAAATRPARSGTPRPAATPTPASRPVADPSGAVPVKAGALRMLAALASYHPITLTRSQLATVSKMKARGGTYQSYLSALRVNGYIVESPDKRLSLTDAGLAAVGSAPSQALTAADVREQWRSALKAGAARMLDVLIDAYPASVARGELAEAVEMTVSGGTFSSYLSILRSNGLAVVDGAGVTASDTLFLEPGAVR